MVQRKINDRKEKKSEKDYKELHREKWVIENKIMTEQNNDRVRET